jgi:hypothetical protein
MIYKGILQQKSYRDGMHYGIFQHGIYYDFMDNFNCQLMDKIRLNIVADKKIVFEEEGILLRTKNLYKEYHYRINRKSIDNVLKKNLEALVEIEMENITLESTRREEQVDGAYKSRTA